MPEAAPTLRRAPQRKMSDEEKSQIRDTLARPDVNYNISVCSQLLGLNYGAVESFVRRDPHLAAMIPEKSAEPMVPSESDIIDRPPLPPDAVLLSASEFEQYQKLMRQSRVMLAKDWEAAGLTRAQGERMENYAKIGSSPIGQVIRSSHGQLITHMAMLGEVIEKDGKMILEGKIPEEHKADGTPKDKDMVEREWRYSLYAGMKLQMDMFVHMNRIQAMMAKAMKDMQDALRKGNAVLPGRLADSARPAAPVSGHDNGAS